MKKTIVTIAIVMACYYCNAQTTNSFPSTGSAGIGTTSPAYTLELQKLGQASTAPTIGITGYSTSGGAGAYLELRKSHSNTLGTLSATSSSDGLGVVDFMGVNTSSAAAYGARIIVIQDGTGGSTYIPAKLSFYTGTSSAAVAENMTIKSNGYVGIGTATPATTLDIGGTIQIAGTAGSTPPSGLSYGLFGYTGVGLGIYSGATSSTQGIGFWTSPGGTQTEVMRILSGGNVGIGTTSPAYKLQAHGTDGGTTAVFGNDNFSSNSGLDGSLFIHSSSSTKIATFESGGTNSGLAFSTNNSGTTTERLRITSSGGVAIGTTDPQGYMLAVNGSTIATSMKVKLHTSWPDYVFQKSYDLPSLTDVKTYIDQNQHLPDMPSAQEVVKNGLDLGETDRLLTQKVEELTLYLIDKDKQLSEQQKQIAIAQQELTDQQKQIQLQNERIEKLEKILLKQTTDQNK